jgi:hypothetical protein
MKFLIVLPLVPLLALLMIERALVLRIARRRVSR